MSVTISAVPFFLIYSVVGGVIAYSNTLEEAKKYNTNSNYHFERKEIEEICNKDFETKIMDKDLLIKTLEEHGAVNITTQGNYISCNCEAFNLSFYKPAEDKPYSLRIAYNPQYSSDNKLENFVDNIGTEYTANAQEVSYNQIKERLEEQNLEIENEEIYDDNTIVLTVNLE